MYEDDELEWDVDARVGNLDVNRLSRLPLLPAGHSTLADRLKDNLRRLP